MFFFQVYGLKKLRVVDASIMPEIISGHTYVPTLMLAEKAADVIKKDYGFLQDGDTLPEKKLQKSNI